MGNSDVTVERPDRRADAAAADPAGRPAAGRPQAEGEAVARVQAATRARRASPTTTSTSSSRTSSWPASSKHGDFTGQVGDWAAVGAIELADRKGEMKLTWTDGADGLAEVKIARSGIEDTVRPLKSDQPLGELQLPQGSGGLLVALYQYRRLLTQGPKGFEGGFTHGGHEPFYPPPADGPTPEALKDLRVDCEVLRTKHGAFEAKWYFDRKDHRLLGFEVVGRQGRRPVRAVLRGLPAGGRPAAAAPDRGPPRRQAVRRADDQELPARPRSDEPDDHSPSYDRPRPLSPDRRSRPAPPPRPTRSPTVADEVNQKLVKLFGSGGFRGIANYGTGILVSPDGHILTVASQMLDTSELSVHLSDGRRMQAVVVVIEPELDVALVKIKVEGKKPDEPTGLDLPYFDFAGRGEAPPAEPGDWVLAFSNLFEIAMRDEPMTVQRGVVAAYTKLHGRRGIFDFPYTGDVYVIDAITNNPGAAGGALTDRKGNLLGIIGKELRNGLSETWINYAIPVEAKVEVKDGEKTVTLSVAEFVEQGDEGQVQAGAEGQGSDRPRRLPRHRLRPERPGADAAVRRGRGPRLAGGQGRPQAGRPGELPRRRAGAEHQGVPRLHPADPAGGGGAARGPPRGQAARRSKSPSANTRRPLPRRPRSRSDRTATSNAIPRTIGPSGSLALPRLALWCSCGRPRQGVNEANEKAAKEAAAAAAPFVVRIETAGGRELIGGPTAIGPGAGVRKGDRPDHRRRRRQGRLRHLQRLQLRQQADRHLRHRPRPAAAGRQGRRHRHDADADAAEGGRQGPAGADGGPEGRDPRRPVGRWRWAGRSTRRSPGCRRSASGSSAPPAASGARRSRPTPRCRRSTTAGRWSTSTAG